LYAQLCKPICHFLHIGSCLWVNILLLLLLFSFYLFFIFVYLFIYFIFFSSFFLLLLFFYFFINSLFLFIYIYIYIIACLGARYILPIMSGKIWHLFWFGIMFEKYLLWTWELDCENGLKVNFRQHFLMFLVHCIWEKTSVIKQIVFKLTFSFNFLFVCQSLNLFIKFSFCGQQPVCAIDLF